MVVKFDETTRHDPPNPVARPGREPGPDAIPHRAALFDMDRTLVRVNTGNLYIRWRFGRREASLGEVARFTKWMTQYLLGVVDPAEVSARALETIAGLDEERFRRECRDWYETTVRPHISKHALEEVERRRAEGRVLAILSASTPYAVEPLAEDLAIDHVLCTDLEVRDGRLTGKCLELCYGDGKVERAQRWACSQGVDLAHSAFYTDSVSDIPMLELVGEPRIVNPDPRLRVLARRRGWPVEKWR